MMGNYTEYERRKAIEEGYESRIEDLEKTIEDFKEGDANPLNYADLKDENRRLQDLLDMHEEAHGRQLNDLAKYEKELVALKKIAEAAELLSANTKSLAIEKRGIIELVGVTNYHVVEDCCTRVDNRINQWRGGEDA